MTVSDFAECVFIGLILGLALSVVYGKVRKWWILRRVNKYLKQRQAELPPNAILPHLPSMNPYVNQLFIQALTDEAKAKAEKEGE